MPDSSRLGRAWSSLTGLPRRGEPSGEGRGKAIDIFDAVDEDRAHPQIQRRREVHVEAVSYRHAARGLDAEMARRLLERLPRRLAAQRIVEADQDCEPGSHPESLQALLADESRIVGREGKGIALGEGLGPGRASRLDAATRPARCIPRASARSWRCDAESGEQLPRLVLPSPASSRSAAARRSSPRPPRRQPQLSPQPLHQHILLVGGVRRIRIEGTIQVENQGGAFGPHCEDLHFFSAAPCGRGSSSPSPSLRPRGRNEALVRRLSAVGGKPGDPLLGHPLQLLLDPLSHEFAIVEHRGYGTVMMHKADDLGK